MKKSRRQHDDGLALAFARAARSVRGRIAAISEPTDGCATMLAVAVLWQTSLIGTPRLKELAEGLHVSPPTLTPIVARLVREGRLTRARDGSDARAARFALTSSGRRALASGTKKIIAAVETMLTPLTAKQRKELLAILTLLA